MKIRMLSLAGASLAALALGAVLAVGQDNKERVVARVDGTDITAPSLEIAEEDIGQALANAPPESRQDYLIAYLTDMKVLALSAEKEGVANDEGFKRKLSYLRDKALMEILLEREVSKAVNDQAARAFYDTEIAKAPKETEIRARHVLVESEDEAKAVIAELGKGGDFNKIASEKTKDPSGKEDGGDLGFFTKDQMVGEFSEAAFALKPGEFSKAPVKTQFGYHVIKVEELREKTAPPFEEIGERIRVYLVRKAQTELVAKLREGFKIEKIAAPVAPAAPATPEAAPATPPAAQPKAQ